MKLSVIIPVYNGAETIAFALESVLYQNTDFNYEIIVYDDCSTDETKDIVQNYLSKFSRIRYYANKENSGNAQTFYNATKVACGEYIHVLDADDFFTSWNKLQKQVDFLDGNPDYCAVAHESLKLYGDSINFDGLTKMTEATHKYGYDASKLFLLYYHTSTFMYKNVFKNKSYAILKNDFCRGDEIRSQLILAITNEKIKNLGFIGSVYNCHGNGLWTSMSRQEQKSYTIECLRKRSEQIFSGIEKRALIEKIKGFEADKTKTKNIHYLNLDKCLNGISRLLSVATYADKTRREELFQNCNYFQQADQLLESIGRILLFKKRLLLVDRQYDRDTYLFTVSGFKTDQGGGIIRELLEFIETFLSAGKRVIICSTEQVPTDQSIVDKCFTAENLSFIRAKGASRLDKLEFLIDEIYSICPERMYPFVSHFDVVGAALIQKHLAAEIIMSWVYDHGTSLAVSNSSISSYIAKNSSYYYTLKSIWKHNRINIIPVSYDQKHGKLYVPFEGHSKLVTATASARSYKIETEYKYSYVDIIANILEQGGGRHYHYGPLSVTAKRLLREALERHNVTADKFIHVEWVEDLSLSLIANGVDLFLSSFPVGSARIAVEVNSIGIPILSHRSINRLFSLEGFISPSNFWWENSDELFGWICNLTAEDLARCSENVRKYYKSNNDPALTRPLLLNNGSVPYVASEVIPKSFVDIPILGFHNGGLSCAKRLRYRFYKQLHAIPVLGSVLITDKRIKKIRRALAL
jgi:glycosyltransferase involved in cell wall biosynthesis